MPKLPFNPSEWYWYVGGDQTKAYSSALGDYVLSSDPVFQTWLSLGNVPTNINTEVDLGDVLANYQLRPTNTNVLDKYKTSLANDIGLQVIFKVLFNHENRIRTLEGQPTVTVAQAIAGIKALM